MFLSDREALAGRIEAKRAAIRRVKRKERNRSKGLLQQKRRGGG
jgi:hypothetical protein